MPFLWVYFCIPIKSIRQAEAEVVPSSSLVEDEVEVEVWD